MWATIGSIFSFLAGLVGLGNKAADQAKVSADQTAGATSQRLVDSTAVLSVAKASVLTANDIDQRSTDDLRAEAEKWRAES